MKYYITGFLLAFQFFTSLPIHKQLKMNRQSVTAMFSLLPIISILMGCSSALILFVNDAFFHFSSLLVAILIVVAHIVMTGGLHLDGWIDLGDAFFSYRNREKRLEILSDSRIGAFGAISLVVLLMLKVGFIYEILHHHFSPMIFFIMIPLLSRMAMQLYFITTPNVKSEGLAAYFKNKIIASFVWVSLFFFSTVVIAAAYYFASYQILFLFVGMFLIVWLYRHWTMKVFGGLTGDLLGALYEGMEMVLWGMLSLFI